MDDRIVEIKGATIDRAALDTFVKATSSQYTRGMPLTFGTVFRTSEFRWLDYLKVDLRNLLHTVQEYEYFRPLRVGDEPLIKTRLAEKKERRSLTFYTLETEVLCGEELVLIARSTFVVKVGE